VSRLDALRSMMRGAARRAGSELAKRGGLDELRHALGELAHQRLLLPEAAIGAAIARAHGVVSASATVREGEVWIDADFDDGEHLEARLCPRAPTVAPRGAKELVWDIAPEAATRSRHLGAVVSAVSAAVAHALWAMVLPRGTPDVDALIDRQSSSCLRVDLRTVPAVRALMSKGGAGAVIELLELEALEATPGALRLQLRLPGLAR
jgi:hypothetical protein